jgi:hypothetical protein
MLRFGGAVASTVNFSREEQPLRLSLLICLTEAGNVTFFNEEHPANIVYCIVVKFTKHKNSSKKCIVVLPLKI